MIQRSALVSTFQFETSRPKPFVRLRPDRILPGRDAGQFIFDLVTTRAAFDALEEEWDELFVRAGRGEQMFQTFAWAWHWANHFLDRRHALAIVTVREAGRLIAVVPLCVERTGGISSLVFLGDPVSQYGDAVIDDVPQSASILSQALRFAITRTRVDVVRLSKVRDDSAIAPVLAAFGATCTSAEEAPYADLARAGSLATYNQRFTAKNLKNRRRHARRLDERGTVALDWSLAGSLAASSARTTMVLKRAWLKAQGLMSRAFADPRTDAFFADVCAGVVRPAGAQVTMLTSGGEIANAAITVTAKGRQAIHILAYGLKFEKCSAGVLHVERLVENAFATGVTTLDFLAPRHAYKDEWCDGAIRVADYALPVSIIGHVYTHVYLGIVREWLKRALRAAPKMRSQPMALLRRVVALVRAPRSAE